MKNKKRLYYLGAFAAFVASILFIMWAGNDFQALRSSEPPIEVRFDMHYQVKSMAQEPSSFFADRKVMRDEVPGTMSREGYRYMYTKWEDAEKELKNPFAGNRDVLARGKNRFQAFCAVCHSPSGQDTTPVVKKGWFKPPNLAAPNAKKYSDAHLYHVVSMGQNVMPGYADKLTPEDRWAVVNYVRELQKAPLKYAVPAADTTKKADTTKVAALTRQGGK